MGRIQYFSEEMLKRKMSNGTYQDPIVPNLAIKVTNGNASYVCRKATRTKWKEVYLAPKKDISLTEAREKCLSVLSELELAKSGFLTICKQQMERRSGKASKEIWKNLIKQTARWHHRINCTIEDREVRAFIDEMEEKYMPRTVVILVNLLKQVLTHVKNPATWKIYNKIQPCNNVLTREQFLKLHDFLLRDYKENDNYNNFFLIVMLTGCRPSELLDTEKRKIENTGVIHCKDPKNRNQKKLFVRKELLRKKGSTYYILPTEEEDRRKGLTQSTIYGRVLVEFKKKLEESKIGVKLKFQDLRRTYTTISLENGHSVQDVSQSLGHKSLRSILSYISTQGASAKKVSEDFYTKICS